MPDRGDFRDLPGSRHPRKLRLWHLSAIVLVNALLFGFLREQEDRPLVASLIGLFFLLTFIGILGTAFVLGLKVGNRLSLALLKWGERRGGLSGFLVSGLAVLVYILIGVAATAIGFIAGCAWFGLLYYIVGD